MLEYLHSITMPKLAPTDEFLCCDPTKIVPAETYIEVTSNRRGFYCDSYLVRGRLVCQRSLGTWRISAYKTPLAEADGHYIIAIAHDERKMIGYSTGLLVDLLRFGVVEQFVDDMDTVDQGAYDGAEALRVIGPPFWRRRDLLFISELTEVLPAYRRRGLAFEMKRVSLEIGKCGRRAIDMLLQPFPLCLELVSESTVVGGKRLVGRDEFDRRQAEIMHYWLRRFPFLRPLPLGGFNKDRAFHLGRLP